MYKHRQGIVRIRTYRHAHAHPSIRTRPTTLQPFRAEAGCPRLSMEIPLVGAVRISGNGARARNIRGTKFCRAADPDGPRRVNRDDARGGKLDSVTRLIRNH